MQRLHELVPLRAGEEVSIEVGPSLDGGKCHKGSRELWMFDLICAIKEVVNFAKINLPWQCCNEEMEEE